jgi:carboxypeptidase Taq
MFRNPRVVELIRAYKPIWALDHAAALLSWDCETYMPQRGAAPRGEARAQLALMKKKRLMDISMQLRRIENINDFDDYDAGIVRVLGRDAHYYSKVPSNLISKFEKVTTQAVVAWERAFNRSSFRLFKPWLNQIVDLKRQEAEKLEFQKHPYNVFLDNYEEGITVDDMDKLFDQLIPRSQSILRRVKKSGKFQSETALERQAYGREEMRRANGSLLRLFGAPSKRFRLDTSRHPFTAKISTDDVRITTKYSATDFRKSIYSTLHEYGHALYDLQIDRHLAYTPLGRGASSGIHESQSRFWENIIGRSSAFVNLVLPKLTKDLRFLAGYDSGEVLQYFNAVGPGLIRMDADEISYNFHIEMRYEIEKGLLDGKISVSDLPSLWSDKIERYVGMKPKTDSEGILQDIHWSTGTFGYFPCYTIGNIVSAMVFHRIQMDVNLDSEVHSGRFGVIASWLREKIHRWGATYAPKVLQERALGERYNPRYLMDYLENKFLNVREQ